MTFREIIGNEELKHSLARMVENSRLGHAVLLCEESGGGAFAFAAALAQLVNCHNPADGDSCGVCPSCHKYGKLIHPDLHFAFPVSSSSILSEKEKKAPVSDYFIHQFRELASANPYFSEQDLYNAIGIEAKNSCISVNESKRIFEKLSLRASEGKYKVMIIFLPEKMNADAANKLLKLLEEPPLQTLFLLISHNPERILKTIRSRCQRLDLRPLSAEDRLRSGASSDNAEMRGKFCAILNAGLQNSLSKMFPLWNSLSEMGREKQKEFCLYAELFLRKIFLVAQGVESIALISPEESIQVHELASLLHPDFYARAFEALEDTLSCIEGNINSKLLFCNLCNQFLNAGKR